MSDSTGNPVYKLMTDNLPLVLINVLIKPILNTKVSQGSLVMHLRCGKEF